MADFELLDVGQRAACSKGHWTISSSTEFELDAGLGVSIPAGVKLLV
jgi:hypothetical protein